MFPVSCVSNIRLPAAYITITLAWGRGGGQALHIWVKTEDIRTREGHRCSIVWVAFVHSILIFSLFLGKLGVSSHFCMCHQNPVKGWPCELGVRSCELAMNWVSAVTFACAARTLSGADQVLIVHYTVTLALIMQTEAYKRPSLRIELYLWIYTIYLLPQWQSSSDRVGKSIWPAFRKYYHSKIKGSGWIPLPIALILCRAL